MVSRQPHGVRTSFHIVVTVAWVAGSAWAATAETGGPCSLKLGDLNFDLRADICDLKALVNNYGGSNPCADLNQDGYVDAYDYYVLSEIVSREPQSCDDQPGALETASFGGSSENSSANPIATESRTGWLDRWWPWWAVILLVFVMVVGAAAYDRRRSQASSAR